MYIVAAEQPLQSQKRRVKNIASAFGEFLEIKSPDEETPQIVPDWLVPPATLNFVLKALW